ncbi:MAG: hypothetical protein H0U63_03735, partial [Burkholderiales bacterium]|nr:hypothetical protein [Burkholderiales bacterium]
MTKKSTLTALTAIALLTCGSAYAAQGKQAKAQKGDQARATKSAEVEPAPVRLIRQPIAKSDALQSGVTEEQFARVDKNGDGSLDTQEISATASATESSPQPTSAGQGQRQGSQQR